MRTVSLCMLALLFAASACKKSTSGPDPEPTSYQPTAVFYQTQYGSYTLWSMIFRSSSNAAYIHSAAPNTSFTYEITGSNGMRTTADTTVKGTGLTDATGWAYISTTALFHYNDGTLTLKIRFNNTAGTTIEATTKKEEFIVRNYRDLLAINDLTNFNKASPSDTYVQAQDIAFPDSTLTAAPIYSLKANYDGQGYKITNLTIVHRSSTASMIEWLGLFAFIRKNVTVKNIKLELSATGFNTPNQGYCGGIAGVNEGSVLNCSVKGNIKGGSTSWVGGITGETNNGKIIGCSYTGTLEGYRTGGLSGILGSSYVNMCYSNYSVITAIGGGLVGGFFSYADKLPRDTVYNCYAYLKQATVSSKLYSLFFTHDPAYVPFVYDSCYSNAGVAQTKTLSYSTIQELNSRVNALQVSNLPAGIPAPPANKPFKSTGDLNQPPVLWWE